MRVLATFALLVIAVSVSAQGTKTPATNTQTKQDTKTPATKTPATKTAAPTTTAPGTKAAATKGAPPARQGLAIAPETAPRVQLPAIMREDYDYDAGGRRDPFMSLLTSDDLRPTVADLKLVNIIFDESGRRPIAVMRDLSTNTQYRVTTGSTLGRLKVALIKRRAVIFSVEEFGLNRQDSLVLGDTSKARTR
jgi:hypothetical protein